MLNFSVIHDIHEKPWFVPVTNVEGNKCLDLKENEDGTFQASTNDGHTQIASVDDPNQKAESIAVSAEIAKDLKLHGAVTYGKKVILDDFTPRLEE